MDGEGTVMVLKRRRDARDGRPLIATMHGAATTEPQARDAGPTRRKSPHGRGQARPPVDGEGTVMVLKRRRDARDRRPLIATMHGNVDTAGHEA